MIETLRKNLFLEFSMKHIAESEQEETPTGTTIEPDSSDSSKNSEETGSECCSDCCLDCCSAFCDNFHLIFESCCCDANSNGVCDCVDCCDAL